MHYFGAMNSTTMIQFLTDKPLAYYKKSSMINSNGFCEQCKSKSKKVNCYECKKGYCSTCFKSKHSKGTLRKHNWNAFNESSKISSIEETNSSYVTAIDSSYVTVIDSDKSNSYRMEVSNTPSNSLLNRNYDEESNEKSFAAAINEWRQSRVSSVTRKSVAQRSTAIGTRDYINDYNLLDTFMNNMKSSISYLDRIAIKMGMRNSIPKNFNQKVSIEEAVVDEKLITPKEESFILSFAFPSQDSLSSICSSQDSLMQDGFEIDIRSCDEEDEEVQNKPKNSERNQNNPEITCMVVEEGNNHCLKNFKCDDVFLPAKDSTRLWRPKPIYEGLDKYYLLGMHAFDVSNQSEIIGSFVNQTNIIGTRNFSNQTDIIGTRGFSNQIIKTGSNYIMTSEYEKRKFKFHYDQEKFWNPELFNNLH
nr:uncharacterized protein LOC100213320 isoform X2 [Hydra vulgaris]